MLSILKLTFYITVNRRLDEWVTADNIDLNEVQKPSKRGSTSELSTSTDAISGRKLTRNLKRRFDEINHVQKVHNVKYINLFYFIKH